MESEVEYLKAKFPNGHDDFIPLCLEEIELHSNKNRDYAHGGDPLGNFNRVSEMLKAWNIQLTPYEVAWIYFLKQVDAVGNMLGNDYMGTVEGVKQRLLDISVYAKLVAILYDHRRA